MIAQPIGFTGFIPIKRRTRVYGRVREKSLWKQGASEGSSNLVEYSG